MSNKIQYQQHLTPALQSGDYHIEVETGSAVSSGSDFPTLNKYFSVQGERFSVAPNVVHSVFPPKNSLGEHSNLFPHIIFRKNTLPWERSPNNDSQTTTWLALLVFNQEEAPQPSEAGTTNVLSIASLGDLVSESGSSPFFPGLQLEYGQNTDDQVVVIDVEKSLLATLLPSWEDLKYLAHAREETTPEGEEVETLAALIANRLPSPNKTSVVHLISLEDRFHSPNGDGQFEFNFQSANDTHLIRLVSLQSWSFTCLDAEQNYERLVKNLNLDIPGLRLPNSGNTYADTYLKQGAVPLGHQMRRGDQLVSWYHGPLTPGPNTNTAELPVRSSDQLLRYNSTTGILDTSYSAAWELGKLLALKNKQFALDLFNYKRAFALDQNQTSQITNTYLGNDNPGAPTPPESVVNWFKDLSLLKKIPFNYLVPDEHLLPPESIRFFYLDPLWMDCLFDGAYNIGRVTEADEDRDLLSWPAVQPLNTDPETDEVLPITGVILRSQVVAGWPGLIINGYGAPLGDMNVDGQADADGDGSPEDTKLSVLRADRLSDSVLLYLFSGEVKTVDVLLKSKSLHFGFDTNGEEDPTYKKEVRNSFGLQLEPEDPENPFGDDSDQYTLFLKSDTDALTDTNKMVIPQNRVFNIHALATQLESMLLDLNAKAAADDLDPVYDALGDGFASADFALQMIEGTPVIRFTNGYWNS